MSLKNKALIMGILNITPDSFSDGGKYTDPRKAYLQIESLIHDKADIIDIGAQASGPNSIKITPEEELQRLNSFLEVNPLNNFDNKVIFSLDTYHSSIAEQGLRKGFSIINDISSMRFDKRMINIIKDYQAQIVIMHSKEHAQSPHATREEKSYEDIISSVKDFFNERIDYALKNGLKEDQIILDPGMGMFISPDPVYSVELIERAHELKLAFKDYKLLYGVSRKGFIKSITGEENLDMASKIIEIKLINQGIDIIRTHNVKMLND